MMFLVSGYTKWMKEYRHKNTYNLVDEGREGKGREGSAHVEEYCTIRFVKASIKNIGVPLVIRAARLDECCGYACLSGVEYDVKTGYTAR